VQEAEDVVGPASRVRQGGVFAGLELEPTASAQRRDDGRARPLVEPVQDLAQRVRREGRRLGGDERLQDRRADQEVAKRPSGKRVKQGEDALELADRRERLDVVRSEPPVHSAISAQLAGSLAATSCASSGAATDLPVSRNFDVGHLLTTR